MTISIPESLKDEHEAFIREIASLAKELGGLGEAAKELQDVATAHFEKEDKFAFPPLGVLPTLAAGKWWWPGLGDAFDVTEGFKAWVERLLEEHRIIAELLKKLTDVAPKDKVAEYGDFAKRLILHAKREEEVIYPTIILIGDYLKIKLHK